MDDEFKILIGTILDDNAKGDIQKQLSDIKDLSIAISKATLDESAIAAIRNQLAGYGIDASVLLKDDGSMASKAQKMGEEAGRNMKQGVEQGLSAGTIEWKIDTRTYEAQIEKMTSDLSRFGEESGESFRAAQVALADMQEAYEGMISSFGDEDAMSQWASNYSKAFQTAKNMLTELRADRENQIDIKFNNETFTTQLQDMTNQVGQFSQSSSDTFTKAADSLGDMTRAYNDMLSTSGDDRIEAENRYNDALTTTKNLLKQLKDEGATTSKALENIQQGLDTEKYSTQLTQLQSQLSQFDSESGETFDRANASINQATEAYNTMLTVSGDERIQAEKDFQTAVDTSKNLLTQLKIEQQAVNESAAQMSDIQYNIDTEKYASDIAQLTANLNQFGVESGEAFNKAAASLEEVKKAYQDMLNASDNKERIEAEKRYQEALDTTKNLLKEIKSEGETKTVTSDNSQRLNLIKQMNTYLEKNSAMTKENKAAVQEWIAILSSSDNMTVGALKNIQSQFKQLQIEIETTGQKGLSFGDQLSKMWSSFSAIGITGMASMKAIQMIRSIPKTVQEVNTAQTELIKVTDATSHQFAEYWDMAAESAKKYGTTISEYIESTADWSRLGYNLADAKELADATSLLQKVGDNMTQETSSEGVIAILRGFQMEADEAMHIVDILNEVANTEPIDTLGLVEGLERSASSLNAANNSLEQSVALITTANSVVQNPEAVGTAFKTITMRIRAAKTEMEEAGLDTEGMATSVAKLREEVKALSGVDIMINDDTFKSTYDILDEMSQKWQDLTDVEQAAITELFAGKRNGNVMSALMTNFDLARDTYETALNNSVDSATKELEHWNKSIDASIAHFQATWQSLSTNILNADLIKEIVDIGTSVINTVDNIINKFGMLNTVAVGGGIAMFVSHLKDFYEIGQAVSKLDMFSNMFNAGEIDKAGIAFGNLSSAQQKVILTSKALSPAQKELLLESQGLTQAEAEQAVATGALSTSESVATGITTTLTGAMNALKTAITTNPLFMAAAAVAGVYALCKAVDYFTTTLDEARDAALEAGEAYEEADNDLKELEKELKTNSDRIDELNSKDSLTFIEQEELNKLEEANKQLERQIHNQEILAKQKKGETVAAGEDYLNQQTTYTRYTGQQTNEYTGQTNAGYETTMGTQLEVMEARVEDYAKLVDRKKELDEQMAQFEAENDNYEESDEYQAMAKELADVEQAANNAQTAIMGFIDTASGFTGAFDSDSDYLKRVNNVTDTFYEIEGVGTQTAEEVTEAFNNVWDSPAFADAREKLLALADAGELTPETLTSTNEYKRLINETGMTAEEVCSHIKALNKEASNIGGTSTTSGIKDTIKSLDSLGSNLKNVTKLYESFQKAGKGSFSNSDLSALLDQSEELAGVDLEGFVDTLTDIGSTEEDIQAAFDDLTTQIIVQRGIVDEINEANAAYVEEQLLAQGVTIDYSMAISEQTAAETDEAMTKEWCNSVTEGSIEELFNEIGVTDAARDSFYGYVAAKLTDFVVSTGGDIEQLSAVIGALGEGANAWYQYYAARAQADAASAKAEQYRQRGKYVEAESMDRVAASYMSDAESYKITAQAVEAKATTPVAPGGSGGGGGGGGGGKKGGGGGGGGGGGSGSSAEPKETVYDWMSQKLDVLDEQVDKLQDKIDNLVGYKNKNAVTDTELDILADKMDILQQMYDRYMAEAEQVELSADYIEKIQNGTIEIETITDEDLADRIDEYQKWYDEAKSVQKEIDDTKKSIKELNLSKLDNIIDQFNDLADIQGQIVDTQEQLLDWYISSGIEEVDIDNYVSLGQRQLDIARQNYKAYQELSREMKKMNLQAGTEEWKKYNDQLQDFKNNMLSAASAVEEYKDSMKDLVYKELNDFASAMDSINGTISTMQNLIGTTNLVDEAGNLTDLGLTQVALYAQTMQTSQQLTVEYAEAIDSLDEALDEGLITQDEYNELLYDYISAQEDAINATKEAKDAILDLVREGMQAEIDNMRTLTDEAIAALEAEQDLYEYQKSINEQEANIVTLQKKIAALSNATSGTELATRLQLEQQLADAEADLYDTEYEHSIEVQKQALEDAYDAYEEEKNAEMDELDSSLAAQDAAIEKYLKEVEDDYQTVYNVLTEYGDEYSLYAIDALTAPWDSSKDAANLCADAMGDVCAQISYDIASIDISPLYDMIAALQTIASYGYGGGYGEGYYEDVTGQGTWQKNSTGWWYGNSNDDYVSGGYYNINGQTYGFNDDGYMITGWDDSQGEWSYFDSSGAMVKSDWAKDKKGDWYYLTSSGQMARDAAIKATDGSGYYYYVDDNGKWDGRYLTAEDVRAAGYRTAYKSGTPSARRGFALTNEAGPEIVANNEGVLSQFEGGETVFSNDMVRNLWDFANNPSSYLNRVGNNGYEATGREPMQVNYSPSVVVEGSADEKTIETLQNVMHEQMVDFTQKEMFSVIKRAGITYRR